MGKTELKADQIETTSFEEKVETAVNTGTASDDLVHKNGDTMTGALTVPTLQVGTSQIILKTDEINQRLGVKVENPQSTVHINGDIRLTTGGIQFSDTLTADPKLVIYKGGTDFAIIRRYADDYTILQIWAPDSTWFSSNEATLSLVRGNEPNQEYIDLYTMDYGDPKHGIRIQRRGTGQYRPFVFEFSDGNTVDEIIKIEDTKITVNKELDVNNTLKIQNELYVNNEKIYALPVGTVLMYDGTGIADVETRTEEIGGRTGDTISLPGWYVCNGNSGTPNLLNKFIRSEAVSGNTGGSDDAVVVSHYHTGTTGNESANHTHSGTTSTANVNHTHTISISDVNAAYGSAGALGTSSPNNSLTTSGFSTNHTHSFTTGTQSAHHTHSFTTSTVGVDGTGKNMPAYYSLIFIKRMS